MTLDAFPRFHAVFQSETVRAQQLGVQVFISWQGNSEHFSLGENFAGEPLSDDHLMPWLSAGKPVTAVAVLQLVEAGELELDQPVARYIPEFGNTGKQQLTVRDLLTHQAGLRALATGWPHRPWNEIIHRICESPQQTHWEQSSRAAYDPARTWFILGELVRRITQRPIEDYVRDEILLPLGMTRSRMSFPPEVYAQSRLGILYSIQGGVRTPTAAHQPDACLAPSPGGSMRGPAAELGRFYEMLLMQGRAPNGRPILRESTVDQMTRRVRVGLYDQTFQHIVDFGLGLIVNSNRYGPETVPYGFGRYSSERAFGHGGAQSSIAFVDPGHDLVVVIIANGCPGEEAHNHRHRELVSAIYEDLRLVAPRS